MKKPIFLFLLLSVTSLGLAGCTVPADEEATPNNQAIHQTTFKFEDDTMVNCLLAYTEDTIALECDWEGTGPEYEYKKETFDDIEARTSIEELNGKTIRCVHVEEYSDRGDLTCDKDG